MSHSFDPEQVEQKILRSLRSQLQQGLLTLPEYEQAARNALKAHAALQRDVVTLDGTGTLRFVLRNTRQQEDLGLIDRDTAQRLRTAAIFAKAGETTAQVDVGTSSSPQSKSPRTPAAPPAPSEQQQPRSSPRGSPRPLTVSPRGVEATDVRPPPAAYSPFELKTTSDPYGANKTTEAASAKLDATIALRLECRIEGTTVKDHKTLLGVKSTPAFVVRVWSALGSLEFHVKRRYNEFLRCCRELQEIWPERDWPLLPKKNAVVYEDAAVVKQLQHTLNQFLELVCADDLMVRSPTFVRFIDPKSNPTLDDVRGAAVASGWLEYRKVRDAPAHQSLALHLDGGGWLKQRVWAVVARGRLYLYPNRAAGDCEPVQVVPLQLCTVELDETSKSILVDRWCVGQVLQVRVPAPSSVLSIIGDDDTGDMAAQRAGGKEPPLWNHINLYRHLCRASATAAHKRFVRLMSPEAAASRLESSLELIRRATFVQSGVPRLKASQDRLYYEADRASNVFIEQGVLRAGTPAKLVEKLLDHRLCPPASIVAFLLTFHSFLSPHALLDQLLSYYAKPPASSNSKPLTKGLRLSPRSAAAAEKAANALKAEQLRVLTILQRWITVGSYDFVVDKALCASLQSFVMSLQDPVMRQKLVTLINRVIFKQQQDLLDKETTSPISSPPTSPPTSPPLSRSADEPAATAPTQKQHSSLGRERGRLASKLQDEVLLSPGPARKVVVDLDHSSGTIRFAPTSEPACEPVPMTKQPRRRGDIPWPRSSPTRKELSMSGGFIVSTSLTNSASNVAGAPGKADRVLGRSQPQPHQPQPPAPAPALKRRTSYSGTSDASVSKQLHRHFGAPMLPQLFPNVDWDLLSLAPDEVARQLTLQHSKLFARVKPRELLEQRWVTRGSGDAGRASEAPNVALWTEAFNVLSGTVSTTILRVDDVRERAGTLLRWIRVAETCFELNSFCCLMAVMSALLNASVYRLQRTWDIVRKRDEMRHAQFERLVEVCSSERNYKVMRHMLRTAQPPILPYLGVHLQDLTFIDEGNKNVIEVEGARLISLEKRLQYAAVIQDIMLYQSVSHTTTLREVPEIQRYLQRFSPLTADKMYKRSLILEPRT